ncbi:MAG: peptidylprolyl isomerase [Xanthomonadales bacterium]|nr:peptidylprolyl isomerase [Xanthomonadales bacterium]
MNRWLREPLLHFLAAGALLFVLFYALNDGAGAAPGEITVDAQRQQALATQFRRTWNRPPTREELDGLVEAWVNEEILYREGLAMGLEQEDPIVRRRVAQKMQFISEDLAASAPPGDEELQAWLEQHADDYQLPPVLSFRQLYFDPERHENLEDVVTRTRATLTAGQMAAAGDPTLLPETLDDTPLPQVARIFGETFASELLDAPEGQWSGPVDSAYGVHLVLVEERTPARAPTLDEVRQAVERDLLAARREQAEQALLDALRQQYTVTREPWPPAEGGKDDGTARAGQ